MIKELTKEQQDLMPEYIRKYTDIGLSTKQASAERVQEIIHQVYDIGKVKRPKTILIVDSPLAIFYAYALLEELKNHEGALLNVRDNVRDNVWDNVWNNVLNNVLNNVRNNVLNNVRDNVWNNVGNNVWNNVGNNVLNNVLNNVRDNVWNNVWNGLIYGSHNASWLSYYSFMLNVLKLPIGEINGLLNSLELGWFYAGKEVCIVSQNPVELHFNDRGRLHRENGMATQYADGYGLYAWHGIIIDWEKSWVVTSPEKITIDSINTEPNAEIRRVMVEIFTFERYIKESGAQSIDKSKWGELYSLDLGLSEPAKLCYVTNCTAEPDGTYKKYAIPVPPHIKTCLEGLTWSFEGLTEAEYSNLILET